MKVSELKEPFILEDIVSKLYHRWDIDKVVEYASKRYEVSNTDIQDLEDFIRKVEKEVTTLRHSL